MSKQSNPENLIQPANGLEGCVRAFPTLLEHGSLHGYLMTLVLMGVALWVRLALAPLSAGLQYVTFFPSVTLAAIAWGYKAGLLATAVGLAFATFIFVPPYLTISWEVLQASMWSNLVFLVDGIIVSFGIEAMHRYRRRYVSELRQSREAQAALRRSEDERKRTEHVVRESEIRYRTLVENSPVCIHEIDLDGKLTSMNRAGLLMMGTQDECAVLGLPYLDAVSTDDRDRIGELLAMAYVGEISHFEFKSAGERPRIFKSCFVPLTNREGEVEKLMGITEDITERKTVEEHIRNLAFNDALTQLPNRRLLMDRLEHALATSARSKRYGAVLFIDLDNFKSLNDTVGHDKGDMLLQQVAQRLTRSVRVGDTIARLGGDEFVVVIEGTSEILGECVAQVEVVGAKVLSALNQPYMLSGYEHRSSASIGVALFRGHDHSIDELLKQADLAMYRSKKAGRNTLRFFDAETDSGKAR